MSPAVNYGYLCRQLEGLQVLGCKGSINYVCALGGEEAPFLPKHRMGMGY